MYKDLTDKELECLYDRFCEKSFDININPIYRDISREETHFIIKEIEKRKINDFSMKGDR